MAGKLKDASDKVSGDVPITTPVILTGPYGQHILEDVTPSVNILCIAGGTGITFVLPVLLGVIREKANISRKIELVWAVRQEADTKWIKADLDQLRAAGLSHHVKIRIFVTREPTREKTAPASNDEKSEVVAEANASPSSSSQNGVEISISHPQNTDTPQNRRPHLDDIVLQFVSGVARGPTTVFGSGPLQMTGALRSVVATQNRRGTGWGVDDNSNVRLICDDRIEW